MTDRSTITGKVVVVTGAGSGIGREAARAFLNKGAQVILIGRRRATLQETITLSDGTNDGSVVVADVASEADVTEAFDHIAARFGRIDLLFNNAGVFPAAVPFDVLELADWSRSLDVNLTGAFLCARAAFRLMKRQDPAGGRIINNGSVSAQSPRPMAAAYTAAKHGMSGLTKAISLDGRPWNIACGQIDIGNADTDLFSGKVSHSMQANGQMMTEPSMPVSAVIDCLLAMAALPLGANVQSMTVLATTMPLIGRG